MKSDLSRLEGKRVLITGASGLIGKTLVSKLLQLNGKKPVEVVALVRDEKKARMALSFVPQKNLEYLISDICDIKCENLGIDYIIHGASPTASAMFVEKPVEVIMNTVIGTKNILEFARANKVKGMVYLSTMEIYGSPSTDNKISENSPCNLDVTKARSSYPESKRLCECLCASYSSEYGVPVKMARLTQTFGSGVSYGDNRIFAEIARCIIEKRDIVLKTKGETKRNYVSVNDAADAIFTILLDGEAGQAYNVANEKTYCSIYDMASMAAAEFGEGYTKVRVCEEVNIESLGYAPILKMNLDCSKLANLGWETKDDLKQMFAETIFYMKNNVNQ